MCWLGEEMGGRWRGLLQLINAMQFYCCPFLVQNEKEGKNTHLHNIERARLCPNFPSQIWSKKCSQRTRNYQPFSFSICCFIPVRHGQQQELNKLPFSTTQTSRNWLLAGQFLMIFHQTIFLLAIFMQNSKPWTYDTHSLTAQKVHLFSLCNIFPHSHTNTHTFETFNINFLRLVKALCFKDEIHKFVTPTRFSKH